MMQFAQCLVTVFSSTQCDWLQCSFLIMGFKRLHKPGGAGTFASQLEVNELLHDAELTEL
jgi:hypothetical protein